jgi:hypothetical protein
MCQLEALASTVVPAAQARQAGLEQDDCQAALAASATWSLAKGAGLERLRNHRDLTQPEFQTI